MKVQITVDEQLWRRAKVSAMLRGQSLGELVGVALGDLLKNVLLSDGLGAFEKVLESPVTAVPAKAEPKKDSGGGQPVSRGRTGGSTPPTAAKPVVVQSKSIGGVSVGSIVAQPSDYEAVPEHLCAVCRERKLQTEMTYHAKTMKWVCNDCVENQKNQQ